MTKGRDYLALFVLRPAGTVGRIDLVLHVPSRFDLAKMVPADPPSPGMSMNDNELYKDYGPPHGFRPIGWTGSNLENLGPEKAFRADIAV